MAEERQCNITWIFMQGSQQDHIMTSLTWVKSSYHGRWKCKVREEGFWEKQFFLLDTAELFCNFYSMNSVKLYCSNAQTRYFMWEFKNLCTNQKAPVDVCTAQVRSSVKSDFHRHKHVFVLYDRFDKRFLVWCDLVDKHFSVYFFLIDRRFSPHCFVAMWLGRQTLCGIFFDDRQTLFA